VKLLTCVLFAALFAPSLTPSQVKAVPPGVRQADQAESQTESRIPPPAAAQSIRVDLAKLQKDADDLARIAQTIPLDVSSIQKGLLPKDMGEKLRQIEKLSKHLRSQINR
jgi:hypothetical protein